MPDVSKTNAGNRGAELAEPLIPEGDRQHAAGERKRINNISRALSESQLHGGDQSVISNADDFDTKKSGLHHISQVLHDSQTKSEWIDEFIAICLVGGCWLFLLVSAAKWMWRILQGGIDGSAPSAVALAKLAGDLILGVSLIAIQLLWMTMCYKSTPVHSFWQGKYTKLFTNTLMPGGFAPRPTALSLGTLMFVTSTLIQEDLKKGSDLDESTMNKYEGCRAVEMEHVNADQQWLNRLHRHGPANMGYTCFNVHQSDALGYMFSSEAFNWTDYENVTMLVHPKLQVNGNSTGAESTLQNIIVNFFSQHLVDPSKYKDTFEWECKYQCIKWQSVGIKSLLSSVSILLVGCATVTKFTDLLSRNFGGKHIKGQFVSEDTSPDDMFNILRRTLKMNCIPKSRTSCFLALIFSLIGPLQMIAPKICLDGYYSVDYWVSAIFISSLLIALLLRRWNPYLNAPMVYTRKLWEDGEDMFVKIDPPHDTEYVKIDLYQWFHLNAQQRNSHLFKYARRVSSEDIDQEIKRQKGAMGKCLTVRCPEKNQIDGHYGQQKPNKLTNLQKLASSEGRVGKFEHAIIDGTSFEYVERSHKWRLNVAGGRNFWSETTEHGNPPPGGKWAATEDESETINLEISKSVGAKDKSSKKDIDCTAGSVIESRNIGDKTVIPKHFRLKEGKVNYDPALDEGEPLMVMSLNTFETIEWVEGVESDIDADSTLPDDCADSKFLVRKVRTTIAKGTVGVVVAKKSKEEAVINWCVGEKRFFPPLKDMAPQDPIDNRIKATAKLTNLMEMGMGWKKVRADLLKIKNDMKDRVQVDDLQMRDFNEPSDDDTIPYCYRSDVERGTEQ